MIGEIIRMVHLKGYGFVKDEDGHDRFLHVRDLLDSRVFPSLREGDRVEFEPTVRSGNNGKNNGLGVSKVQRCDD